MSRESIKYIVLSGGGIHGLCHIGALYVFTCLFPSIYEFHGYAGVSIGSFVSLCLVCRVPISTIVNHFKTYEQSVTGLNVSFFNFEKNKGLCDGYHPLDKLVKDTLCRIGPDTMTFKELFDRTGKQFIVGATNLCTSSIWYFDHTRTPNTSVLSAVLASMAMPMILAPINIDGQLFIDGGVCINFPFHVFPAQETIGLWLHHNAHEQLSPGYILQNSMNYIKAVGACMYYAHDVLTDESTLAIYRNRIVVIPTIYSTPLPGFFTKNDLDNMQRQGFMAALFHMNQFFTLSPYDLNNIIVTGLIHNILNV